MMTERTMNTQPLMERDALSPSEPATDEIVILGYDSYPTRTEVLPIAPSQEQELSEEDKRTLRIDHDATAMMREIDGWLQFRVRSEVLSQTFKGLKRLDPEDEAKANEDLTDQEIADKEIEKKYIDITKISAIVSSEVARFGDEHYQAALLLENDTIPKAEMRDSPVLDSKNPSIYWKRDVDNLRTRVDVHDEVVRRIELLGVKDADVLDEFAEAYIARVQDSVRDEVIAVLLQQKNELEIEGQRQIQKIKELENTIDILVDQSISSLDEELVARRTEEAIVIAR